MIGLPQGTGEPQVDQPRPDGAEPNGVEQGLAEQSAQGVANNPWGDAERAEVKRLQEQWEKEKQKREELMARAQGMTQGQLWEWRKKTRDEIGSGWTRQDEQRLEAERLNEFFNTDSKQQTNDKITYKSWIHYERQELARIQEIERNAYHGGKGGHRRFHGGPATPIPQREGARMGGHQSPRRKRLKSRSSQRERSQGVGGLERSEGRGSVSAHGRSLWDVPQQAKEDRWEPEALGPEGPPPLVSTAASRDE
jgi:hypothetical protein